MGNWGYNPTYIYLAHLRLAFLHVERTIDGKNMHQFGDRLKRFIWCFRMFASTSSFPIWPSLAARYCILPVSQHWFIFIVVHFTYYMDSFTIWICFMENGCFFCSLRSLKDHTPVNYHSHGESTILIAFTRNNMIFSMAMWKFTPEKKKRMILGKL